MSLTIPRVLIAIIGKPDEKLLEAARGAANHFSTNGGLADIYVQQDLCVIPYHGLGAMRNTAVMLARERGYDWLMMLDTDVFFEKPDVLTRLWARKKHAIIPYLVQEHLEKQPHRLTEPQFTKDSEKGGFRPVRWKAEDYGVTIPASGVPDSSGLLRLKWSVLSCVLFDCQVFTRVGERPFVDSLIISEDEYNGLWFRRNGVEWWQDLSVEVKLLKPPTELWKNLEQLGGRKPEILRPQEMEAVIQNASP